MKFHKCYTEENKLAEIFQQKRCRMQLCRIEGDDCYLVHQPVLCRDFLGDIYWANTNERPYTIYGMSYDPAKDNSHINLDEINLLIKFPNVVDLEYFLGNFGLLNDYEQAQGIPKSTHKVMENSSVLVKGDKFWTKHIFRISYYTFLLRCLSYEFSTSTTLEELLKQIEKSPEGSNEKNYVKNYSPRFWKFFKNFSSYTSDKLVPHTSIEMIHNYSGFVAVLNGDVKYGFTL